ARTRSPRSRARPSTTTTCSTTPRTSRPWTARHPRCCSSRCWIDSVRGIWLEHGAVRLADDLPRPQTASGEALLRVRLAGLCTTDLELMKGYAGFSGVPGHEFVAEVVSAPGAERWTGRRVVAEINVACGACAECAAGRRTHCARRTVLGIRGRHGGLAEYVSAPLANLHEVP